MIDNPDQTPVYQPPESQPNPTGVPYADPKDAKGMVRMINKMLKPKFKMPRGKGIQSDQSVHVKHGKNKVKYY